MDRPMVLIYIALAMGTSAYFLFQYFGIVVGILWFLLFLLFLKKLNDKTFAIILFLFFILPILNCQLYFNSTIREDISSCRIVEDKKSYYIGDVSSKRIEVISNDKLELGERYSFKGSFKEEKDYSKGIVGKYTVCEKAKLKTDFTAKIYKDKEEYYSNLVDSGLKEDEAGIILAISTGDTNYLSYEKKEQLNILGISHIISVSGLHLTLVYGVLSKLVGYRIALLLSFLFTLFTGSKPSTIRAFIMILMMVLGTKIRKKYDSISSLATAAFVLILIRPYYILDVGYMLSFLAVLGILIYNKKINRRLYKLPSFISNSLSLSTSAMIFTLPYLIFIFNKVSFGGFISNLLLIPFYTGEVILGIIAFLMQKVPFAFGVVVKVIKILFLIITTIENGLSQIIVSPLAFTYFQGLVILFLYLSYELIKRGVSSLKFFPIILMVLVIKEPYNVFPEVSFIEGKKSDIVEVNYKGKDVLISGDKVKFKYYYEDHTKVDRIYDEFENCMDLTLNENYKLHFKEENKNLLTFFSYKNEKKYLFKEEETKYSNSYEKCDIINFESNDKKVGRYYGRVKIIGPYVVRKYVGGK